jgi:hypothetical protein
MDMHIHKQTQIRQVSQSEQLEMERIRRERFADLPQHVSDGVVFVSSEETVIAAANVIDGIIAEGRQAVAGGLGSGVAAGGSVSVSGYRVCVCVCMYVCMYVCACIYVCVHIYIYIYIHIYIYTYIYTLMYIHVCNW